MKTEQEIRLQIKDLKKYAENCFEVTNWMRFAEAKSKVEVLEWVLGEEE